MKRNTYIAFALTIVGMISWCALGYFALSIGGVADTRLAEIDAAQQLLTQQNASIRMHAIAQETAADRTKLERLLAPDIVSIVGTLRGVGKAAGVSVHLGAAVPGAVFAPTQDGLSVQTVGFALEAEGPFSSLMRTLELVEALPLASSIERLDIQRSPGSTGAPWHMDIFLRVLTTSAISS